MKANGGKYVTTRGERRIFMKMVFALLLITLLGKACGLDKEKKTTGFVNIDTITVATVEMTEKQL